MAGANIIADSSIWIDHLNKGDAELVALIKHRRIAVHAMVIGEVALGSIANRRLALSELREMPQVRPALHEEVLAMIEWLKLFGSGIGFVDAHLLAAARQLQDGRLWTRDKRLLAQAQRLEIAYVS